MFDPIIDDLKKFYDGYQIERNGTRFEIFGKVLLCTGDTFGQHLWGSFKEGVGFAFQKCRSWLVIWMKRNKVYPKMILLWE